MRLTRFSVFNYKSARNVTIGLTDDRPVTLIGVNDCGKSTVLKGLQLFFDEGAKVYFDGDDTKKRTLSNTPLTKVEFDTAFTGMDLPNFDAYDECQICMLCEFVLDEKSYESVESLSLHLQYILQRKKAGEKIYVLRLLSAAGSKDEYYILTDEIIDENKQPLELWSKKAADIIAIQKAYKIENSSIENQNNTGKPTNIERISAIYSSATLSPAWSRFDYKKDRALFPEYRYLDWNITADELNQLTADVIRPIVSEALESIAKEVNTKKAAINTDANASLATVYSKYKEFLPDTVKGLSANVDIKVNHVVTELFVTKTTSDQAVHVDEQGDGIRRQIWFGLIKARADEVAGEDSFKRYIWCFDEPETHLYPMAQRELAESLSTMASGSFQVLVSTHSTLFVDRTNLNDINQVSLVDGYTVVESTGNTEDVFNSLGVKNSDFLFFNKFIAVEGPTEYQILDYFYELVYGHSMYSDGIQLLSLRGKDNATNCEELINDIFKDFRKPVNSVIYIFDKDTKREEKENVILLGTICDFEDALSNEVWIRLLSKSCGVSITDSELNSIRDTINIDLSSTKFHKQLGDFVAAKPENERTGYLPSKGTDLAPALRTSITDPKDIPQGIKNAFERARK